MWRGRRGYSTKPDEASVRVRVRVGVTLVSPPKAPRDTALYAAPRELRARSYLVTCGMKPGLKKRFDVVNPTLLD